MGASARATLVYQGLYSMMPLSVAESMDGEGAHLALTLDGHEHALEKYAWSEFVELAPGQPAGRLYLGRTLEQVMQSGRDLLGEAVLAAGEPSYETVKGILPPLTVGDYAFVGGAAGWRCAILEASGELRTQDHRKTEHHQYLFRPVEIDAELGAIQPVRVLLDGKLPIVLSVHRGEARTLELMYFVEPGEPGADPTVWVRALIYDNAARKPLAERLLFAGFDTTTGERLNDVSADLFWDAFASAVLYWEKYLSTYAHCAVADRELQRALYACLGSMAVTFAGDHPHYGHEGYGWDVHDHFPPSVLTALEASASLGNLAFARGILDHVLRFSIDESGRFYYRQGEHMLNGASASEYGQLLWLIERYADVLLPHPALVEPYFGKLTAIGELLMRNRQPSELHKDLRLIRMCAEADTNGRIYDYVQNSLWAVRGLQALSALLVRHGQRGGDRFAAEAEDLLRDARLAIERESVDTQFGLLPPFQLGYPAIPLNLSSCLATFVSVEPGEFARYRSEHDFRNPIGKGQNYVENTYANYRYYLELLATRLLTPEQERAIQKMREELGGELLGMTRFLDRMDDWPAFNYARYLIETDQIDKYLLLMFAHTQYHGIPQLQVYYEQVSADGKVVAPDCVPSLLIMPLMVSWMFAMEPVSESALYLLRAVPSAWYREGFSVDGLETRWGKVSLRYETGAEARLTVHLPTIPDGIPVYLDVPEKDALLDTPEGARWVSGKRLLLAPRQGRLELRFRSAGTYHRE